MENFIETEIDDRGYDKNGKKKRGRKPLIQVTEFDIPDEYRMSCITYPLKSPKIIQKRIPAQ